LTDVNVFAHYQLADDVSGGVPATTMSMQQIRGSTLLRMRCCRRLNQRVSNETEQICPLTLAWTVIRFHSNLDLVHYLPPVEAITTKEALGMVQDHLSWLGIGLLRGRRLGVNSHASIAANASPLHKVVKHRRISCHTASQRANGDCSLSAPLLQDKKQPGAPFKQSRVPQHTFCHRLAHFAR